MNEKKQENRTYMMGGILLAIFAFCLILSLLLGVQLYSKNQRRNEESYKIRTAIQYIATMVRKNDVFNAISVKNIENINVLLVKEKIEGETFCSYIYEYDGILRTVFADENYDFSLKDGEEIMEISGFNVALTKNILTVTVGEEKLKIKLRSGDLVYE